MVFEPALETFRHEEAIKQLTRNAFWYTLLHLFCTRCLFWVSVNEVQLQSCYVICESSGELAIMSPMERYLDEEIEKDESYLNFALRMQIQSR